MKYNHNFYYSKNITMSLQVSKNENYKEIKEKLKYVF
jgi:hypothetical protein